MSEASNRPRFDYIPKPEEKRPRFDYTPESVNESRRPYFDYVPSLQNTLSQLIQPTGHWLGIFVPIFLDKHEKPFG